MVVGAPEIMDLVQQTGIFRKLLMTMNGNGGGEHDGIGARETLGRSPSSPKGCCNTGHPKEVAVILKMKRG